ncbi:hypothetical protein, partial [Klebsiella variicola]|uniref:hypothetical protein n=1 Tax=Klebsiella variicola TaxID=244366 RepID=UPI001952FDB9
ASLLDRLGVGGRPSAEAPPPSTGRGDGSIALSSNERRNIVIEPVALRPFRPQFTTEGKIATDEDRATPVLSP